MIERHLQQNNQLVPGADDVVVVVQEDLKHGQANADLDAMLGERLASVGGPSMIRLWRSASASGLSVSRRDLASATSDEAVNWLRHQGLDLVIRQTGGTAVPQGDGVLHLSWLLPRTRSAVMTDTYFRLLCSLLLQWLCSLGIGDAGIGPVANSYCDGKYNILVGGRKLAGTAQAWRGGLAGTATVHPGYVLAHACITVDVDFDAASEWINGFYSRTGNAYRVHSSAAVTLRSLLAETVGTRAEGASGSNRRTVPSSRQSDFTGLAADSSCSPKIVNQAALTSLYAFVRRYVSEPQQPRLPK